jgi:hypothetical protein
MNRPSTKSQSRLVGVKKDTQGARTGKRSQAGYFEAAGR